ncbi:hypothetical protein FTUN_1310 [Frigoriglobus tundricola]|uniref:Uncharacterized protein n=1 Tax=Frigoriglobus tundricola TaxID=2774151 RepID=A0A6M5YI86_9BACT|nr:hypothetical protein FTUN_1310 [Frigoriglobus tundricola]
MPHPNGPLLWPNKAAHRPGHDYSVRQKGPASNTKQVTWPGPLVSDREGSAIGPQDHVNCVGYLLGVYSVRRLHPAEAGDPVADFLEQRKHLWLFESIPESVVPSKSPILMSNTRLNSQHAIMRVYVFLVR